MQEQKDSIPWVRVDLHIHTPASEDYSEPDVSYLDILKEAERRELRIIAFTDHNTVHGYEQFKAELEFLQRMADLGRCTPEEQDRLAEYQRLLEKVLVLPGFEFTSHYGAHILGVFDPATPLSVLEAVLLQLGIPSDQIKSGSCAIPNTRHVTEAYEIIFRSGGIVIAPHVNSPTGIVNETIRMNVSGQSRIAATQSPYLHALEFVNFHASSDRFLSPAFYDGSHEHYSRPMFCIQGSDAHCLTPQPDVPRRTSGVGMRYFEAQLETITFTHLKQVFASQDISLIRVPQQDQKNWELEQLRSQGDTRYQLLRIADQEYLDEAWKDLAALANADGGLLALSLNDASPKVVDIQNQLATSIKVNLDTNLEIACEEFDINNQKVLRVEVLSALQPPCVSEDGQVFVRRDTETVPANRDELIQLVRRSITTGEFSPLDNGEELDLPRSGVEIVGDQKRNGVWTYEVRDLRTTTGVERDRAQGLWAYAISRHEDLRDSNVDLYHHAFWQGRLGVWRVFQQGNRTKYDLAHRDASGVIDHIFYGVSDWGLSEGWQNLLRSYHQEQDQFEPAIEQQVIDIPDDEFLVPDMPTPTENQAAWGERRIRWRNRGAIWRIHTNEDLVLFDLASKQPNSNDVQEYKDIPFNQLKDSWLAMIRVNPPNTGIEVVDVMYDEYGRLFRFRNLRSNEISDPWRQEDLETGTVREYAARMFMRDLPLNDDEVRWWGNIGYMRPMRSQVDLVYRDEFAKDHVFYAARREELEDIWNELLEQWPDE